MVTNSHPARGRVLVVNDDARLAESVRTLLSEEGYEAQAVPDGLAAIAALERWPADIVLLDLIMPRLDGLGFLERRAMQPCLARPAVVLWSIAPPEQLAQARALGAAECLPGATSDPERLLESIACVMATRGQPDYY